MPDVPGTTLNSTPGWLAWLDLFQNQVMRPPVMPLATNTNANSAAGLPLMAPPMVGHPIGLREREKSILERFGNG